MTMTIISLAPAAGRSRHVREDPSLLVCEELLPCPAAMMMMTMTTITMTTTTITVIVIIGSVAPPSSCLSAKISRCWFGGSPGDCVDDDNNDNNNDVYL